MEKDEIQGLVPPKLLTEEDMTYVEEHGYDPRKVLNMKEFRKFIEYSQKSILNEKKIRIADDGRTVNLGWLPHMFKKKMEGVPKAEYVKFDTLRKLYVRTVGKRNRAKQVAFGVNSKGMYGQAKVFKLLDARKTELIELFGRMFSTNEVLQIVIEDWGMECSKMTLDRFAQTYSEEIREKQEWYKQNYSDVRLGHKRSRLDELTWMYTSAKIKYKDGGKSNDTGRLLLSVLQQIKSEVEGDIVISGTIDMNIEHTMSVHVRHELMKSMNINSLILSRVALKLGINPVLLINKLQKSYYAKFTTLNGEIPQNTDDMPLPSKEPYDFKQIEDAQVIIDRDEAAEVRAVEKEQEEQRELLEGQDLKGRLKNMLNQHTHQLAVAKRKVNVLEMGKKPKEEGTELERLNKKNIKNRGWQRGVPRKKKKTTEEDILQDIIKINKKKK